MTRFVENIVVPFLEEKPVALKLEIDHPALAIFDRFKGQNTIEIRSLLKRYNIISVTVPTTCTDRLQPLDVSLNKPIKEAMRKKFQM